jgi:drug/metabolite transporter (DMT)-like permease
MRPAVATHRMRLAPWLAYRVATPTIALPTRTRTRGADPLSRGTAPGDEDQLAMNATPALHSVTTASPTRARLSTTTLAILALAGAAALWGTSFVAAKVVLAEVPPVTLACLRFVIAAVVLLPLSLRRRRPVLNRDAALLGLTGISVFFLLQYAGLRLASAADATLVLGGGLPLLTTLLGFVVLAEKLDRWQLGGLTCSLLGVALVALDGEGRSGSSAWGLGLLFLAAACGAISFIVGRRVFSGPDLIPTLAGSTVYGVVFLLPVAAFELHTVGLAMPSQRALLFLLYLGAGCSALAFALWAYGLRHLTATQNALVSNLELPIGLLAALLLGEALGWGQLAGGPLIVAGALLAAAAPRREGGHVSGLDRETAPVERLAA